MRLSRSSCLAILSLIGCASTDLPADGRAVDEVANNIDDFARDEVVKVCGWATNQFENAQVTKHRQGRWNKGATQTGLGVFWLQTEPRTDGPEHRCITGRIEPNCGWDWYDNRNENQICISTGTSFNWSVRQTALSRY
ncbi:MAG: hypothetical protein AAF583_15910 [Pseudomonadota bacterium]